MKWRAAVITICSAGVVGLLAAIGISFVSDRNAGNAEMSAPAATPALIARGAYLAKLGDCAACHSVPGKPAFSGGLRMATPIGAIYSTNITPDDIYGIGRFSLADFDRALRFGVADGHTLYPAMPYTSYYNTTPEDVAALYAFFRQGVAAAAIQNQPGEIPFPLSMRWPLTYWRWLFTSRPEPFRASPGMTPDVARGAYFVNGMGHCGECHTPRAITLQVKAIEPSDGPAYLSGAVIENFFAPSLRSGGAGTIGGWTDSELAEFLRTGANAHGIAFGSMIDVIVHSTQYLTEQDALAAARYLKTIRGPGDSPKARFIYDKTEHEALRNGDASKPGAMIYLDNCAACHRPDGAGYERVFPRLAGNPVAESDNPLSLVTMVLLGSVTPRTQSTPARFAMPGFAWRMSDQEVAECVTFIRGSWGNRASAITPDDVARVRKQTGAVYASEP